MTMFVLSKTHKKIVRELETKCLKQEIQINLMKIQVYHLRQQGANTGVFTQDDIKKLLQLCHPDRHGGKQLASEMTSKLLEFRRVLQ